VPAPRGWLACGAHCEVDAGLAQITMGRAWWFRKYADEQYPEDRARYEFAEREARAKEAELWRDGTAVPPWEWREGRRKPQQQALRDIVAALI